MARSRNPKAPKAAVIAELLESSDDDSDEESVEDDNNAKKDTSTATVTEDAATAPDVVKNKYKKRKKSDFYIPENVENEEVLSEKCVEMNIAFCCFSCQCSDELKKLVTDKETWGVIAPGSGCLFHRRCCHSAIKWSETWVSPLERALQDALPTDENLHLLGCETPEYKDASIDEVLKKYKSFKKLESEIYNADYIACKFTSKTVFLHTQTYL